MVICTGRVRNAAPTRSGRRREPGTPVEVRTLAITLLAIALLATGGCHRRARARSQGLPPGVPRVLEHVMRQAQTELDCREIEHVVPVLPGVVQVRGCGVRREYVLPGRREHAVPVLPVEIRASAELQCAQRELHVESPAPAVRAVIGCGRRARYDLHCRGRQCEWVMSAHAGSWLGADLATTSSFGWDEPPAPRTHAPAATYGREDPALDAPLPPPPGAPAPSDAPADPPFIPPPPSP